MAQVSRRYADGIILHSTAGHGGFHLDEIANPVVHPLYSNHGGFYEDCNSTLWSTTPASPAGK
jgi:hypothetical protein